MPDNVKESFHRDVCNNQGKMVAGVGLYTSYFIISLSA